MTAVCSEASKVVQGNEGIALSVICPIYNEEGNIGPLYGELKDVLDRLRCRYEVVFVNDGSTDGSRAHLDGLAVADPFVRVVHFRRNFGQTAAMMAGFDLSSGGVVVPIDGDRQNDPRDIPRLLQKLEDGFDVCSGWRKERRDDPIRRTLPSRLANALISVLSGVKLNDYGCTLKAYRREVMAGVRLYGEMHRFIPIFASWQGARVAEIPVNHRARVAGESKYGLGRVLKVVLDLVVVKFLASYQQKPIYVFGGVALLNYVLALAAGALSIILRLTVGISIIRTPLPLLSIMTFITGTMCLLMGLLAEMIVRTYYESQGKRSYVIGEVKNVVGWERPRDKYGIG